MRPIRAWVLGRLGSREVAAGWQWKLFPSLDAVKAQTEEFNRAFDAGRKITIETFATDNSASVQNTMYKMSEQILAEVPGVEHVNYSLPNKHYFEIGRWKSSSIVYTCSF